MSDPPAPPPPRPPSPQVDEHEQQQTSGKVEILPFQQEWNFEQAFFCELQGRERSRRLDCGSRRMRFLLAFVEAAVMKVPGESGMNSDSLF